MDTEITVESCLAELREMFPEHQYIRIKTACSWFGEGEPDTLTRIIVTKYEWAAKTLADCMAQVRKWKEEQDAH